MAGIEETTYPHREIASHIRALGPDVQFEPHSNETSVRIYYTPAPSRLPLLGRVRLAASGILHGKEATARQPEEWAESAFRKDMNGLAGFVCKTIGDLNAEKTAKVLPDITVGMNRGKENFLFMCAAGQKGKDHLRKILQALREQKIPELPANSK